MSQRSLKKKKNVLKDHKGTLRFGFCNLPLCFHFLNLFCGDPSPSGQAKHQRDRQRDHQDRTVSFLHLFISFPSLCTLHKKKKQRQPSHPQLCYFFCWTPFYILRKKKYPWLHPSHYPNSATLDLLSSGFAERATCRTPRSGRPVAARHLASSKSVRRWPRVFYRLVSLFVFQMLVYHDFILMLQKPLLCC